MASARDTDLLTMDGWPLGVNNRLRETEEGPKTTRRDRANTSLSLREAVNVDLTRLGHPIRRKGYELVEAGYTHSLWSHPALGYGLCVHEGYLCQVQPSGVLVQIQEVHAYARVSYTTVNGEVYWSNGLQKGRVTKDSTLHWGLPNPPAPLLAVTENGALAPGRYSVAVTYIDEFDEEYGASAVADVLLQSGQGLDVAVTGQWPDEAAEVAVYVSQPNGEILYRVGEYPGPFTVAIQPGQLGRGMELETQQLHPPEPGRIVRYFNGRIYMARRNTVRFTEPLRYGLTRPAQGLYMFPSEPVLLEPVSDGLFVGTSEGVVFVRGTDPYDVVQTNVLSHAPVPHTVTRVPGELMDAGSSTVPVWWGEDGAMVAGLPGGQVRQLTKDRLAVPRFKSGAMLYREREGMAQVVSSLSKGADASAMGASDSVVAEVRTNTKILNK